MEEEAGHGLEARRFRRFPNRSQSHCEQRCGLDDRTSGVSSRGGDEGLAQRVTSLLEHLFIGEADTILTCSV